MLWGSAAVGDFKQNPDIKQPKEHLQINIQNMWIYIQMNEDTYIIVI